MLLDDARCGDLAIFSDSSQAIIQRIQKPEAGKLVIEFDKEVTGWLNETKRYCWCYNRDGSFSVGDRSITPHIDIVKVVHND